MKNIETPRKKHAGKGIDGGGFEKKKRWNKKNGGGGREKNRTGRKYLSAVLISRKPS